MEKFTLLFFVGILSCVCAIKPGGISDDEKVADAAVKDYVLKTSSEIKIKAAATLVSSGGSATSSDIFDKDTPIALAYKSQIVAGTNYFVKTQIGTRIFHVRIYRDLQGNLSVHSVKGPKNATDPIAYF